MASINAAEAAAEQIAKREKQLEDRELLEEDRQWALQDIKNQIFDINLEIETLDEDIATNKASIELTTDDDDKATLRTEMNEWRAEKVAKKSQIDALHN